MSDRWIHEINFSGPEDASERVIDALPDDVNFEGGHSAVEDKFVWYAIEQTPDRGSWVKAPVPDSPCAACSGHGYRSSIRTAPDPDPAYRCKSCDGSGIDTNLYWVKVGQKPCPTCGDAGAIELEGDTNVTRLAPCPNCANQEAK